jgi:hypothetical protein
MEDELVVGSSSRPVLLDRSQWKRRSAERGRFFTLANLRQRVIEVEKGYLVIVECSVGQ